MLDSVYVRVEFSNESVPRQKVTEFLRVSGDGQDVVLFQRSEDSDLSQPTYLGVCMNSFSDSEVRINV
jgi:hypothetical protein